MDHQDNSIETSILISKLDVIAVSHKNDVRTTLHEWAEAAPELREENKYPSVDETAALSDKKSKQCSHNYALGPMSSLKDHLLSSNAW
jgi:hypothetical protein